MYKVLCLSLGLLSGCATTQPTLPPPPEARNFISTGDLHARASIIRYIEAIEQYQLYLQAHVEQLQKRNAIAPERGCALDVLVEPLFIPKAPELTAALSEVTMINLLVTHIENLTEILKVWNAKVSDARAKCPATIT